MKKSINTFSFLIILLITGCNTRINPQKEYLPAYHQGDFNYSEKKIDQIIQKELPQNNFQKSKEAVWLLLDRATIHFAQGKIDCAIEDYKQAIEAIDFYNQVSVTERISQMLTSDSAEAYAGEDFEQILARIYFSLALLQKGDMSNAYALLQQAEDVQQSKRQEYGETSYTTDYALVDNSLGKYLLAVLSEKRGDLSNAEILYKQANSLCPQSDFKISKEKNRATVLIISHHGSAPYKITGTCPVSQISMTALDSFLAENSKKLYPPLSSMTGIPVPILCQPVYAYPYTIYTLLDEKKKCLSPIYDITAVANEQLNQKIPVIAARGMARLLLRRATVGSVQEQDPRAGAIIDLAMLIVNMNTYSDTRSWSTLPARIDMARHDIAGGEHLLTIESDCHPYLKRHLFLKLKPHDLCVINIFNLRPGIFSIQVPQHFIGNQEIYHEL